MRVIIYRVNTPEDLCSIYKVVGGNVLITYNKSIHESFNKDFYDIKLTDTNFIEVFREGTIDDIVLHTKMLMYSEDRIENLSQKMKNLQNQLNKTYVTRRNRHSVQKDVD